MHKPLIALTAALLATAANAATLIDNVNGVGVDDQGRIFRFSGLVVADVGKVERLSGPMSRNRQPRTQSTAAGAHYYRA